VVFERGMPGAREPHPAVLRRSETMELTESECAVLANEERELCARVAESHKVEVNFGDWWNGTAAETEMWDRCCEMIADRIRSGGSAIPGGESFGLIRIQAGDALGWARTIDLGMACQPSEAIRAVEALVAEHARLKALARVAPADGEAVPRG
jgi:hypothetical protein